MSQAGEIREVKGRSRTQTITGIGLFAALALVLNLAHIQVPAPYLGFLIYEIWEIPIVVCLFLYGLRASLVASAINTIGLILVNPGGLPTGPIYNLIAVTVTLVAIILGHRLSSSGLRISFEILIATGLAIIVRTAVMSIVNYILLPFPTPLGFQIPQNLVVGFLPAIAFFNATLALYTVPLGYAGVRAISRRLPFRLAYPLSSRSAKN